MILVAYPENKANSTNEIERNLGKLPFSLFSLALTGEMGKKNYEKWPNLQVENSYLTLCKKYHIDYSCPRPDAEELQSTTSGNSYIRLLKLNTN